MNVIKNKITHKVNQNMVKRTSKQSIFIIGFLEIIFCFL